ncbi:hypothetical protein GCM10020260_00050 [Nesterenkonia halobia]|uniref:Uncharacterized protein n=1 Tax=Nesterenkonia halobia TaxID=37922 RepID=A0ABP6R7D6_9MICC
MAGLDPATSRLSDRLHGSTIADRSIAATLIWARRAGLIPAVVSPVWGTLADNAPIDEKGPSWD